MVASSISANERDWTKYFVEQLLQQLDGKVALRRVLDFGQKLIGQNRDVRLLQSGGVENVYVFVRRNGTGNDLPDGLLQLFR